MNGLPPKILTSEERVTIRVVSKQPFCLDCPTFQWNLKSKSLSTWNCMQYFVLWIPLLLANLLPVCVSAGHQQLAAAEVGAHEHGSVSETAPRSRCEDCYFTVSFILSKLPEWLAYFFFLPGKTHSNIKGKEYRLNQIICWLSITWLYSGWTDLCTQVTKNKTKTKKHTTKDTDADMVNTLLCHEMHVKDRHKHVVCCSHCQPNRQSWSHWSRSGTPE